MRPIYARELTEGERKTLKKELKSANGIVVRRSQVILMSSDERLNTRQIGARVGYSRETNRKIINRFNDEGVESVYPQSSARKDDHRAFDDLAREKLTELLHHSPRDYDQESSLWTLDLLADVSYELGLTTWRVHFDTISQTLMEMGISFRKAKQHIQSPDENYDTKKNDVIG